MNNLDFNKNDDKMRLLISEVKRKNDKIYLGGGKEKIEKQARDLQLKNFYDAVLAVNKHEEI